MMEFWVDIAVLETVALCVRVRVSLSRQSLVANNEIRFKDTADFELKRSDVCQWKSSCMWLWCVEGSSPSIAFNRSIALMVECETPNFEDSGSSPDAPVIWIINSIG